MISHCNNRRGELEKSKEKTEEVDPFEDISWLTLSADGGL